MNTLKRKIYLKYKLLQDTKLNSKGTIFKWNKWNDDYMNNFGSWVADNKNKEVYSRIYIENHTEIFEHIGNKTNIYDKNTIENSIDECFYSYYINNNPINNKEFHTSGEKTHIKKRNIDIGKEQVMEELIKIFENKAPIDLNHFFLNIIVLFNKNNELLNAFEWYLKTYKKYIVLNEIRKPTFWNSMRMLTFQIDYVSNNSGNEGLMLNKYYWTKIREGAY